MQRMQFTPQVQAAMQAAERVELKKIEAEQEKLLGEFKEEREAGARAIAAKEARAAKIAEKKR